MIHMDKAHRWACVVHFDNILRHGRHFRQMGQRLGQCALEEVAAAIAEDHAASARAEAGEALVGGVQDEHRVAVLLATHAERVRMDVRERVGRNAAHHPLKAAFACQLLARELAARVERIPPMELHPVDGAPASASAERGDN